MTALAAFLLALPSLFRIIDPIGGAVREARRATLSRG
jgi:hypothetical protein